MSTSLGVGQAFQPDSPSPGSSGLRFRDHPTGDKILVVAKTLQTEREAGVLEIPNDAGIADVERLSAADAMGVVTVVRPWLECRDPLEGVEARVSHEPVEGFLS
jgi:hypothetical protein